MISSEAETEDQRGERGERDGESRPEFMRQESYSTDDFTITADVVYIEPDRLAIEEHLHQAPIEQLNHPSTISHQFRRLPQVDHPHEVIYSEDMFADKKAGWEHKIVSEHAMEASLHDNSNGSTAQVGATRNHYYPSPIPKRKDILTVTAPDGVIMSKRANSTSPNHNFKIYGDYDLSPNESYVSSFHISPHVRRATRDIEDATKSPDRRIFDMVANHRGNLRPDAQRPSIVPPLMLDSIEKLS